MDGVNNQNEDGDKNLLYLLDINTNTLRIPIPPRNSHRQRNRDVAICSHVTRELVQFCFVAVFVRFVTNELITETTKRTFNNVRGCVRRNT